MENFFYFVCKQYYSFLFKRFRGVRYEGRRKNIENKNLLNLENDEDSITNKKS